MVFYAEHGVIQAICGGVGFRYPFCFRCGLTVGDDFDPVPVGIEREGDVSHPAVCKLLLEFVACGFDAGAGGLDVVDGDANVAEATVRRGVAVVDCVVGVVFGAVVVGQFEDALAVGPGGGFRDGEGGGVRHEVEVELCFGLRDLLEEGHAKMFVEFDFRAVIACGFGRKWSGMHLIFAGLSLEASNLRICQFQRFEPP